MGLHDWLGNPLSIPSFGWMPNGILGGGPAAVSGYSSGATLEGTNFKFCEYLPVRVGTDVWIADVGGNVVYNGKVLTIELNGSDEMGGGFFTAKVGYNDPEFTGKKYKNMDFCFSDVGKTVFLDAETAGKLCVNGGAAV